VSIDIGEIPEKRDIENTALYHRWQMQNLLIRGLASSKTMTPKSGAGAAVNVVTMLPIKTSRTR
jgi:hypothetical protein